MRLSEIYDKAAEIIETQGWASGAGWYVPDHPAAGEQRCLEGAVAQAAGIPNMLPTNCGHANCVCKAYVGMVLAFDHNPAWTSSEPYRVLRDHLVKMSGWAQRPYLWNDRPGQDPAAVVGMLRRLADIMRKAEPRMTIPEISARYLAATEDKPVVEWHDEALPHPAMLVAEPLKFEPVKFEGVFTEIVAKDLAEEKVVTVKETVPIEESKTLWAKIMTPVTKAKALVSVD